MLEERRRARLPAEAQVVDSEVKVVGPDPQLELLDDDAQLEPEGEGGG